MHPSRNNLYIAALIVGIALVLALVTVRACTNDDEVTLRATTNVGSHAWSYNARWPHPTTTESPLVTDTAPPSVVEKPTPVPAYERPQSFSSDGLNWEAVRQCESGGNYGYDDGTYSGAYNFDDQTWRSVGGSGSAGDASPAEQDARAQRLYDERGAAPWPVCGRQL